MEAFPTIKKNGITIIKVKDQEQGLDIAKDILYEKVDGQTLLLLSGGSTPKNLYEALAKEKKLTAKAIGMVDERIDRSNFEMIKATGLLKNLKIEFYPMTSAEAYDKDIRRLIDSSKNRIAIMGIGSDGHTAGIPARTPHFAKSSRGKQDSNYVMEIDNFSGEFRERITLTFKALSEMDVLIILAFGKNKIEALIEMFKKGPIEEIPSRFYTRSNIASKTLLITDQKI